MVKRLLSQVIEAAELLDSAKVAGNEVATFLRKRGLDRVETTTIKGDKGSTDFLRVLIDGTKGKTRGGKAPTLGIIGRLGGVGARPEALGLVSDADGAITAISVALKLASMLSKGDLLDGDVTVATHICPNAPTEPHVPVPFMGSPIDMATMNRYEVSPEMDAVLSVDATKGNRVIKFNGFAITPTIKDGYILRISDDLVTIMEIVTGRPARIVPITTQDITPYGNGIYHVNSIVQPTTATTAPVVGVATTTSIPVPGCATGANHLLHIEQAGRFCLEVAKAFGRGKCSFYDPDEFKNIIELYGSMRHLQTMGRGISQSD
jgi:hypothetical protein